MGVCVCVHETDCFYSLAVHLVISVRSCEEQTSIPLLVDEEVGKVHLCVCGGGECVCVCVCVCVWCVCGGVC